VSADEFYLSEHFVSLPYTSGGEERLSQAAFARAFLPLK
jgi:hypothetical protein